MLKKKKQSRRSHYTSEQIKKNQNKLFKSSTVSAGEQHNTSVRNKNLSKDNSGNTSGGVSTKTKQGKKRTPAQMAAAKRLADKKAGTYKAPKTAKELAKARLKKKKK